MRRHAPYDPTRILHAALLLTMVALCSPAASAAPGTTTWTILFYDNADFEYAFDPLEAFAEDAHSGPNLDVIVLRDRDHEPADLWHVGENHELTWLEDWGEVNMGDPETLAAFLEYGRTHYPADRVLLAMYGHGGGWTGACRDGTSNDKLSMDDFQQALTAAGPVDLICFTAPCMMGAIESAYELRDLVDVYVGSEEVSGYVFWLTIMDDICQRLISSPDDPSGVIASHIVQLVNENDYWEDRSILTMSAVDAGATTAVIEAVDRLALDLIPRMGTLGNDIRLARHRSHELGVEYADRYGPVDLHDFTTRLGLLTDDPVILQDLEQVRQAIDQAVLAECHGPTQERSHGLSVYFHRGGPFYDPSYETAQLDFADQTAWDEFLNAYYGMLGLPSQCIVTGPGPAAANPPRVRIFNPVRYGHMDSQWDAYGAPAWGVSVACGDLDGTGLDEVVTGAGPGAIYGPHVRGFDHSGQPLPGVNYMAYGTNRFGVNVACGDIDGDGFDEIVTGAGPGAVFGPHVRGWDVDGAAARPMPGVSFFAYGTLKWGVNVACGDIDGDGRDEMLTGPGPSNLFGAHVRGWRFNGTAVSAMPEVNFFAHYFAFTRFGVRVGAADIHGDGIDEILTVPGPDPDEPAQVQVWRVIGETPTLINRVDISAYVDLGLSHGGIITGGKLQ